ncbi:MAG: Nramp family divalent metal transporter [Saccharothrix sp.]|nr:Nramp family divalent metal transporter [Saccharothrix sp.]
MTRRAATRLRTAAALIGPAFVVAVAYVDPGNFATNMAGGARHGYLLLWVVVSASALGMFVQFLSAKLGIATGKGVADLCREHYPRPVTALLWAQAELVTMATDLAEFVGCALALNLLFGLPLLHGALLTGVASTALLLMAPRRRPLFYRAITMLLIVVLLGFLYQTVRAGAPAVALTGLLPRLSDDSLLLATGIFGATVMPHVVYLHSDLTSGLHDTDVARNRAALRTTRADIAVALGIAAVVNVSMLLVAATALPGIGGDSLTEVHAAVTTTLGATAGIAFAVALLASGLAASSVGTYSGEVVMRGFLGRRVPTAVRRLVTMAPAIIVLWLGADPTEALVLSQVVLSFGIPAALIPVVLLGRRRDVMGPLANRPATTLAGVAAAVLVCALNAVLLLHTFST